MNYISANKHEFNVRRVDELIAVIDEKEKELKTTEGFFKTFKLKSEIRRLYRVLRSHGNEVLEYEYQNSKYNTN